MRKCAASRNVLGPSASPWFSPHMERRRVALAAPHPQSVPVP